MISDCKSVWYVVIISEFRWFLINWTILSEIKDASIHKDHCLPSEDLDYKHYLRLYFMSDSYACTSFSPEVKVQWGQVTWSVHVYYILYCAWTFQPILCCCFFGGFFVGKSMKRLIIDGILPLQLDNPIHFVGIRGRLNRDSLL